MDANNAIEDAYPLSYAQQGMLFHSERDRDRAVYHDIVTHEIGAAWVLPVFQTIVDELVAAHPALRTRFQLNNVSRPLQIVQRRAQSIVTVTDLCELAENEQYAIRRSWLEEECRRGIDWNV